MLIRPSLVTTAKTRRDYEDHGDGIFDQAYNKSFHERLKTFQYNVSLGITGAIRVLQEKCFIKNKGLSPYKTDAGFVNSISFFKINLPIISLSYYLLKPPLTTQDRLTVYPFSC